MEYRISWEIALHFLPSTKHCQQVQRSFQFLKLKKLSPDGPGLACHLLMLPKLTLLEFNGIFPGGLNGEGWSSVGCKGVSWSVHCALILCPPQSKECASLGENSLWSFRSRVPHKNMCHVKLLLASRICPTPLQGVLAAVVQNAGRNAEGIEKTSFLSQIDTYASILLCIISLHQEM